MGRLQGVIVAAVWLSAMVAGCESGGDGGAVDGASSDAAASDAALSDSAASDAALSDVALSDAVLSDTGAPGDSGDPGDAGDPGDGGVPSDGGDPSDQGDRLDEGGPIDGGGPDGDPGCVDGELMPCVVEGVEGCAGTRACVDGAFGACTAPAEFCDGIDNDCNGVIDDAPGVGEDCTVGLGACLVAGRMACAVGGAVRCDAVAGEPGVEVCDNGVDEDCSGEADDDVDCLAQCDDDAACGPGTLCIDGACRPGECRADAACAGNELCVDYECRVGNCREDAACAAGALCIEYVCRAGACRDDAACAPGELCIDADCRFADCRVEADCRAGEVCIEGFCQGRPRACADPPVIGAFGVYRGTTAGRSDAVRGSCTNDTGPERGYRLELPGEGLVCLSSDGSPSRVVLHVRGDCADAETELGCDVDGSERRVSNVQFEVEEGDSLSVFVDAVEAEGGDYRLSVLRGGCPCRIDRECQDGLLCRDGACAARACGDGLTEGDEVCDDGNVEPGDGCDASCRVEGGFVCVTAAPGGLARCRPARCETSDECFEDEFCNGGRCVRGDCLDDMVCEAGELCLGNVCTPADCRVDDVCGEGEVCEDARCRPEPDQGALRIVDGEAAHVGRLEFYYDGVWGTVCDDLFERVDADVACRQLGYPGARRALLVYGGGVDPIWLDNVSCRGDEARLEDCPANPIGSENCGHVEDVGVECLLACEADAGCAAGERCVDGACVDGVWCGVDAQCAEGELCVAGLCTAGECHGDVDCPLGTVCARNVCSAELCGNAIDDDRDGATDCVDESCVDDLMCVDRLAICGAARALPGPGAYFGSTAGAGSDFGPTCRGGDGPEAIFVHTPAVDGTLCLSTIGSSFDTVLHVRAAECTALAAEVGCNDDASELAGRFRSALDIEVEAGVDYYVFVDGYGAASEGPFRLTVSEGECAAPVEVCDNGFNDDLDDAVDCDDTECLATEACLAAQCGNGVVDAGEGCDDGGRVPGDGCSAACREEVIDVVRGLSVFDLRLALGDAVAAYFEADRVDMWVEAELRTAEGGCVEGVELRVHPVEDGALGPAVASDVDPGDEGCPRLRAPVPVGEYALVITAVAGEVLLGSTAHFLLAADVGAGGAWRGLLPVRGADLYELALDAPARVTFATGEEDGGCGGDTLLVLYALESGVERVQVGRDDDGGPAACSLLSVELDPGRYGLLVSEFDGRALDYALTVEIAPL